MSFVRSAYDRAYYEAHKEDKANYYAAFRIECLERQATYDMKHRDEKTTYDRAYYEAHKEERKAQSRAYYAAHRDEIRARKREVSRAYYEAHKEECKAKSRVYQQEHRDQLAAYRKAYYAAHKGERKRDRAAYDRAYYAAHKEEVLAKSRAYYAAHRDEILARLRARAAERKLLCGAKGGLIFGCADCFYFGVEHRGKFFCAHDKLFARPLSEEPEAGCFMKDSEGNQMWLSMWEKPSKRRR